MTASHWVLRTNERFHQAFNLCLVVGGLLVFFIGFAAFWQATGARTERAMAYAEKHEAIEMCKRDGLTAFMHVESGKVICGGGPLAKLK